MTWQTVAAAAAIYAVVGAFHYLFRHRFLLISDDVATAYGRGLRVRLWDFLFYMSFGLVITIWVNTAGVLLVFVFLVVPAVIAISITDRLLYQLLIGWTAGTAVSFGGLVGSYVFDLPSGPMVVAVYGLTLLLVALILYIVRSKRPARAVAHTGAGIASVAVIVGGFFALGTSLRGTVAARADAHHAAHQHGGEATGTARPATAGDHATAVSLLARLAKVDVVDRPALLRNAHDAAVVRRAFEQAGDEELRAALARRLLDLDPPAGKMLLLEEMAVGQLPIFRSEAFEALKMSAGESFGYDPLVTPDLPANRTALEQWRAWASMGEHGWPGPTTERMTAGFNDSGISRVLPCSRSARPSLDAHCASAVVSQAPDGFLAARQGLARQRPGGQIAGKVMARRRAVIAPRPCSSETRQIGRSSRR